MLRESIESGKLCAEQTDSSYLYSRLNGPGGRIRASISRVCQILRGRCMQDASFICCTAPSKRDRLSLKCRTKRSNLKTLFFDCRSVLRCKAVLAVFVVVVFKQAERRMGNMHKDRGFHCSVLNEGSSFLWHCQWQIL